MKISALIPFKSDQGHRDRLWAFIRKRYEIILPEIELCLGIDRSEPFCRAKAINTAARQAAGDVFIIVDTDVFFCTALIQRLQTIVYQYPWIIPFANGYKLNKDATIRLLDQDPCGLLTIDGTDIDSNVTLDGAFMNVMTRAAFEAVGGFDERFQGWGGEDNAFVFSLDTICGPHARMREDIFHLWHEPAPVIKEDYQKNLDLCNRYRIARGNPAMMNRLIAERSIDPSRLNSERAEFGKLKEQIRQIEGWLSDNEGELLYNLAFNCQGKGVIVEIGSWRGKSTVWLGRGSLKSNQIRVYAIDPHTGSSEQRAMYGEIQTFEQFLANLKMMQTDEMVIPIVKTSESAAEGFTEPVELIFIDGAHEYEYVKKDFELWFPKVISGGIMAFHDVTCYPGPNRVVEEYVLNSHNFCRGGLVDSIFWAEKI